MEIVKRLDSLLENGSISVYTKKMIVEMSNKVVNHLAQKYDNVKEGVTSIMGGKVLEYEAKQILNEGKIEGRIEQARETAQVLRGMGISEEKIAKAVNVSIGVLKEWFDANQIVRWIERENGTMGEVFSFYTKCNESKTDIVWW